MPPQIGLSPLDREPTLAVNMMSAGVGACFGEITTIPLDTAKVRLMIQGEGCAKGAKLKYRGLFGTMQTIWKTEGARALYSGLTAGLHRQLVLGSVRIGTYDSAKAFYASKIDRSSDINNVSMLTRIASGISTGCMAVLVGQPTDVVKVRMQAQGSTGVVRYSSALSAYGMIARQEGVRGLWKGIMPNATRIAVVNASEIVSYDMIKNWLVRKNIMSDNLPCHFFTAFCAGFITTMIASPVDVVKTRYMNSKPGQYSGVFHCAGNMWMEKGPFAFYKGCFPSFLRLSGWSIVFFVSYEQLKRGLTHGQDYLNKFSSNSAVRAHSWPKSE